MVRPADCIAKYGMPSMKSKWLQVLDIPPIYQYEFLPKHIYCNYDMHQPLIKALMWLKKEDVIKEIKTYDGCFNIRKMRNANAYSLHSWAIAIDLNAFDNPMYSKGKWSKTFIDCMIEAGFDYGGNWIKRTDPMHFQLREI